MTETKSHGGGYFSGLIAGAILGAAAVFLWGTKKGRHLTKVIQDKGGDAFNELEDLAHQAKSTEKKVVKIAQKQLTHLQKLGAKGRSAASRYFDK